MNAPRTELLFTRSKFPALDLWIRAWEGDDASHVGILRGDEVIDATVRHGVAPTPADVWVSKRVIVQRVVVMPTSLMHYCIAERNLLARVGSGYDVLGIVGFPLLRDLDQRNKYWCSELAALWYEDMTGILLPGRKGRRGVRPLRWAAHQREQTLLELPATTLNQL